MAATDRPSPKPRSGRWLRIVFGVSLALNLLVIGLVGGMLVRFGGPPGASPMSRSAGTVLFRELPQEHRDEMRRDMRALMRSNGIPMSGRADEIAALLRAETLDVAAMQALMDVEFDRLNGIQSGVQRAWLERIEAMTPEQRAAYADRVEVALEEHRRRPPRLP